MTDKPDADSSELQVFVTETLNAIMSGIAETRGSAKLGSVHNVGEYQFNAPDEVTFDIAISAENTGSARGGMKLAVFGIGANAGGDVSSKASSISRVQFSVPTKFRRDRDR